MNLRCKQTALVLYRILHRGSKDRFLKQQLTLQLIHNFKLKAIRVASISPGRELAFINTCNAVGVDLLSILDVIVVELDDQQGGIIMKVDEEEDHYHPAFSISPEESRSVSILPSFLLAIPLYRAPVYILLVYLHR